MIFIKILKCKIFEHPTFCHFLTLGLLKHFEFYCNHSHQINFCKNLCCVTLWRNCALHTNISTFHNHPMKISCNLLTSLIILCFLKPFHDKNLVIETVSNDQKSPKLSWNSAWKLSPSRIIFSKNLVFPSLLVLRL